MPGVKSMKLKNFFHICLIFLIGGQFVRLSRGEFNFYLSDLMLVLFTVVGFIYLLVKKSLKINIPLIFFSLFGVVALISLLFNIESYNFNQILISSSYLVRFIAILGTVIVLTNLVYLGELTSDELIEIIISYILAFCLMGFIQYIILPDFTVLDSSLGWDPHKYRLASTFFDPNYAGSFLVLGIAALAYKFDKNKNISVLDFVALISILSGVLITYSRSAWLMLSALVFVLGFKYKTIMLLSILIFFGAYIAVPRIQTRLTGTTDPADSAQFRLISWRKALDVFVANPVLGVGFNAFRYSQESVLVDYSDAKKINSGAGSDSSFLLVLATTGVIGFAMFIVAYLFPIIWSNGNIFVFGITIALALNTQFINSLFYPQILLVFLLLIQVFSNQSSSRKL